MTVNYIPVTCIYPNGMRSSWKFIRRIEEDHEYYYVWYTDHLEPKIFNKLNCKLIKGDYK